MKRRIILIALIIFGFCIIVYSANHRVVGAGDCWALRYVPISLLRDGNLDLNEYEGVRFQVIDTAPRGEHYRVFAGPVLSGILATPVYFIARAVGIPITPFSIAYLGKLSSTIYCALSAVFLFLLLLRLLPVKYCVILSLIYAFGTCTWAVSSQSLWRHGLSQCLVMIALYCLLKALEKPAFAGYSGFFLSLATVNRYMDAPIALILFIYVIHRYRGQAVRFIVCSLPAAVFFMGYNWFYFGSPLTFGTGESLGLFTASLISGLPAILFSPNRGLFVFSPILLFSVVGSVLAWRIHHPARVLYRYIIVAVILFVLLVAKWHMWWGGHSYGYRLLVDITPLLMVLMAPSILWMRRSNLLRSLFVITAAASVLVQLSGAFYYLDYWNSKLKIDRYPERVWLVRSGQFHFMLKKAAQRGWKIQRTVFMPPKHRKDPDRYL